MKGQALAPYRYAGGKDSSTALDDRPESDSGSDLMLRRSSRRAPASTSALRGRMVMAAVAIGAVAAASAGQSLLPKMPAHDSTPMADPSGTVAVLGPSADNLQSLEVQPMARTIDQSAVAAQLAESQQITEGNGSGNTSAQNVDAVTFAKPAAGPVVSTFGGQYGTLHYGIEIQGQKDAPIYAAADGEIIAAGPTSGFGLWVKERLSDGTILVYARMNDYSVQVGQHVVAGTQIARMGDRGFSNGYTLHFEVWQPNGTKIDPVEWLNTRGVTV
jgi:murein DD-endopeptidase MepM/ murein hydrolase activator NlpD